MIDCEELRQYAYCPRIPYWHHVLRLQPPSTFKIRRGKKFHQEIWKKARRWKIFENCKADHGVLLYSEKLGLKGKLDILLECEENLIPVEVKYGSKNVSIPVFSHIIQLVGYSLLIEDVFKKKVRYGFIVYADRNKLVKISIDEKLRRKAISIINEVKKIIEKEYFPAVAERRGKCSQCEYFYACKGV